MSGAAASAGAAGAAAAAAIANAIKASGAIVSVEERAFSKILDRQESPLVVIAEGGFLGTTYKYLTSYKGLAFYMKTRTPIHLPGTCEVIRAGKIWIPG